MATQREYLDFIVDYIALHRRPPAEADMQAFFKVSPPSVHRVVVVLTEKGMVQREPGKARSIQLTDAGMEVLCDGTYPSRPGGLITEPLDPEIAPLVHALQADRLVVTKGSCSGHGEKRAYIDLAVDGAEGMRLFVKRLRAVERSVAWYPKLAAATPEQRQNWRWIGAASVSTGPISTRTSRSEECSAPDPYRPPRTRPHRNPAAPQPWDQLLGRQ